MDIDPKKTLQELKAVEGYAAMVNAWLNTKMERDKSLLTLSAAGIGILVTVVLEMGIRNSSMLLLYRLSLLAFIICLFTVLWIFDRNAVYLEAVSNGKNLSDPVLIQLDRVAMVAFVAGVLLASLMAISSAIDSLFLKGNEMTEEKKTLVVNNPVVSTDTVEFQEARSFNGFAAFLQQADGPSATPPAQQTSADSSSTPHFKW